MVALLGKVEEFDTSKEEWTHYVERMDHIFAANGIHDADKKKSTFLAVNRFGNLYPSEKFGITKQTWRQIVRRVSCRAKETLQPYAYTIRNCPMIEISQPI